MNANDKKPMRLAYRIASMPTVVPDRSVRQSHFWNTDFTPRLTAQAKLIASSPAIILDNVASFYAHHDQSVWDIVDDVPNWSPPFRMFFVEWEEPKEWKIKGKKVASPGWQQGFFVVAFDVKDTNKYDVSSWEDTMARSLGQVSNPNPGQFGIRDCLQESRWMLACHPYMSTSKPPISGHAFWFGMCNFLFVDSKGNAIEGKRGGILRSELMELEELWTSMHVLGLGISFCHCKNVAVADHREDRAGKWHHQRKIPKITFKTLDIGPMKQVLRTEGGSESVGIQKALHICRGHFATYTPEHPLFGKYVGTFWKADHVRGKAEAGVVVKDYNVVPE